MAFLIIDIGHCPDKGASDTTTETEHHSAADLLAPSYRNTGTATPKLAKLPCFQFPLEPVLSRGKMSAMERFLQIPELVTHMLTFLDAYALASLASVHQLTSKVLQGTDILNGEVIRSFHSAL